MTGSFIVDYYLLVFLTSCGLYQIVAAQNRIRGLLFFNSRPGAILFGLALAGGAVAWFFLSESRNVSDSGHGLNGNEQFAYFFAGLSTGLAFTLIVSSLRNFGLGARLTEIPPGLDALRETTYLRILQHGWGRLRLRFHRRANAPAELPVPEQANLSG